MKVSINPLEPKGSLPWVRFAPGNGWSVYDTQTKGAHFPQLEDAVKDYNGSVRRKVKALNVGKLLDGQEFDRLPVQNCPGWGDAVRDEMASRVRAEASKAHEAGSEARHAMEDKTGSDFGRNPFPKHPGRLAGLLGMLMAVGALDGVISDLLDDDDAEKNVIEGADNPQIIKLLREAGIMREIPGPIPGDRAGIVAIPRSFGEEFCNDVEKAIRESNPTALLVLLSGAGLVN